MKFALFNIDCAYLFVDTFIACFYINVESNGRSEEKL